MTFTLSSSLLDACVLAILNKNDTYGYEITQNIKEVVPISDSTLYPVLRRLQNDDCLTTYDKPFLGRNRRYYAITDKGRSLYEFYKVEWDIYKKNIDTILLGGLKNE